jgi:hypothetical protein
MPGGLQMLLKIWTAAARTKFCQVSRCSQSILTNFTPDNFRECIEAAIKHPSLGVVFFSWPLFEKDSERMGIAKESLK